MNIPQEVQAKEGEMVESLVVSVGKKGFHPSGKNYLRIKSYVDTSKTDPFWGMTVSEKVTIRLRIYNSKGKYVFEKKYKDSYGGYLDFKWNGKASKKNNAGLSAGKYVKNGSYKVEVYVAPKDKNSAASKKTYKFKVSSKAASGEKGLSDVKTLPIFTGSANVDYMAEQICKEAKIKNSDSDDEKVRKIYHWLTTHQKHTHYYEGGTFKKYYKLSSSAKKIKKYRAECDKLYKKGKLIYNYDYSLMSEEWCMERRIGVCNDHADMFQILCNHVGVEAGVCSGYYLNRNGTKAPHSWNYAIVDGVTYYYDVDVEIQNYGKGQGDYYWYKKTKSQAKLTHDFHHIY